MGLIDRIAKFGVAPIECEYGMPNCMGGWFPNINHPSYYPVNLVTPISSGGGTVLVNNLPPVVGVPPIACDEGYYAVIDPQTQLQTCIAIPIRQPPIQAPVTANVNPIIGNVISAVSPVNQIKQTVAANPLLALGVLGLGIYLILK